MKNLSARNEERDIPCMADIKPENQALNYTVATNLTKLVVGEKLGVAFGKIAKAVEELINHLSDGVKHITAEERTAWNGKAAGNHTHSNMTAATASAAGKAGFVPAPAAGAQGKYLRGDGTWQTPPDTNTTYSNMTGATASEAGKAGLVPAPAAGEKQRFLKADGTWGNAFTPIVVTQTGTDLNDYITSGIYIFSSAYAPANIPAGTNGWLLVSRSSAEAVKQLWFRLGTPNSNDYSTFVRTRIGSTWSNWRQYATIPPTESAQGKYLRDDGTWQTPPDTNTTYSNMKGATASADGAAGLVPAPVAGLTKRDFLSAAGTWRSPFRDGDEPAGQNLNDCKKGGVYFFVGNAMPENAPESGAGWLMTLENSSNYVKQLWFKLNSSVIYVRACSNNTWSDWKQLALSDEIKEYSNATPTAAGLMSAPDKKKLDGGYMVKSDSNGLYVEY